MGQEIFSILLVDDEKNERKGIEKLIRKMDIHSRYFRQKME